MEKQDDSAILFVRLAPSLKNAIDLLAEQNERSLSQEVRHVLRREVERSRVGEKQ
jgi:predicted HicB family RNase H-like nuclease